MKMSHQSSYLLSGDKESQEKKHVSQLYTKLVEQGIVNDSAIDPIETVDETKNIKIIQWLDKDGTLIGKETLKILHDKNNRVFHSVFTASESTEEDKRN